MPAKIKAILIGLFLLAGLIPGWAWADAAQGLIASGKVLAPDGSPLAGAVISDGTGAVKTGPDGAFSFSSGPDRIITLTAPSGYLPKGRWRRAASELADIGAVFQVKAGPGRAEPLLAIISDPHLFDANTQPIKYPPPPHLIGLPMKTWQSLAAKLKGLAPDLTLVTGDLCSDGEKGGPEHLDAQLSLASKALAMMPNPVRALPGNHDVRYGPGQADISQWRKHLGPARQLFFMGAIAVILLDNNAVAEGFKGRKRICGRLSDEALTWLKDVLAILPANTPLIIASHFPLVSPLAGSNPLKHGPLVKALAGPGLALRNTDQSARAVLGLLKGRPVLALLNGHEHAYQKSTMHTRQGDLFSVGVPALCGAWWHGDRPWGEYHFPPGYLLTRVKSANGRPKLEIKFIEVQF